MLVSHANCCTRDSRIIKERNRLDRPFVSAQFRLTLFVNDKRSRKSIDGGDFK
jgi:hypothetical protein